LAARVFGISQAVQSQPEIRRLFANQGLYNGFLAAGLIWSVLASPPLAASLQLFFLTCVVVAAVYGAATANKAILWKQGGPAIAALLVWLVVHSA
jgi:putative membrane protein